MDGKDGSLRTLGRFGNSLAQFQEDCKVNTGRNKMKDFIMIACLWGGGCCIGYGYRDFIAFSDNLKPCTKVTAMISVKDKWIERKVCLEEGR